MSGPATIDAAAIRIGQGALVIDFTSRYRPLAVPRL